MDLFKINKKLFKYMIILVVILVVFVLVIGIIKLTGGSKLSYQKIEDKMKQAAISYVKDKGAEFTLPSDNEITTISVEDLVANKNMKELSKYLKNDSVSCTGSVNVKKHDDYYLYIPNLDCGDDYQTMSLKDNIIKKGIVSSGDGLYYINNEYIFRGEYVNNYVKFANQIWRIIKIDSNGNIKLLQENSKERNNWDNRYNIDFKSAVGINNYELSRVNQRLEELYASIFDEEQKKYIATKDLCIGKRYAGDTTKDGVTECAELSKNKKVGLIQINEFLMASLDANCQKIRDGACQNYNYLAKYNENWWSITANASKTSNVYEVIGGNTDTSNASVSKVLRLSIYLNDDVIYVSGDGTLENPYIFK